jgi:transposase
LGVSLEVVEKRQGGECTALTKAWEKFHEAVESKRQAEKAARQRHEQAREEALEIYKSAG